MKSPIKHRLRLLFACGLLLATHRPATALPVFPGAVGFGTDTAAGRGGTVYRVTNLNNSGSGSLRYGVESIQGPRVIVFDVSGVIELASNIVVRNNSFGNYGYLTIAGQTAPAPGITLKNAGISVNTSHVLIQHIGIRPGNSLMPVDNRDAIQVGAQSGYPVSHVVIDHVSCSWAVDEMVSVWSDQSSVSNVTFSNSIFSHPIINGGHTKGSHGYGPLSGRNCSNVTMIGNIMAFNTGRNPLIRDRTGGAQVVNNFIYRPGVWPNAVIYLGSSTHPTGMTITNSVIGNVIVRHPIPFSLDTTDATGTTTTQTYNTYYNTGIYVHDDMPAGARVFVADNRIYNPQNATWYPTDGNPYSSTIFRDSSTNPVVRLSSDPYANSGGTVWSPVSSTNVEADLLATAGKHPGQRDFYDAELASDITARSGNFLEYLSDLGSNPWGPVNVQNTRVLALPSNPNFVNPDGYTNLEKWLHDLAAEVEGSTPLDPPGLISDAFADGNADGWTPDGGTWGVASQVYQQTDTGSTAVRSVLNGTHWTDQVIEADVRPMAVDGTNRFFGVVARYRNSTDYYYFVLRTNNTIELKKLAGGGVTTIDSGAFTVALGTTYRLKLEVEGTALRAYINGNLVLQGTDSTHSSGRVGLITYFSAVDFDDILAHSNQEDLTPPSVALTTPANNATVSSSITVAADASDNVGVVGVQFKLDGADLGGEDTSAPYSIGWDTTTVSDAAHVLTAVARDADGNTTTSSAVMVTVSNGSGSPIAYEEDFGDGQAQGWTAAMGTWSVFDGYYRQTANDYPDIAVYDGGTWATDFTYSASLLTSWSATNNRVGMIYNYVDANNYYYVIFNAAGLAEINRVINGGAPVVVATGSYSGGGSGVWFDVEISRSGSNTTVEVNGSPVFTNVSQTELGAGKVGLITRFNASARFDDISVTTAASVAIFDTFEDGNATGWSNDGGTWSVVSDGTQVLRQTDNGVTAVRAVIDATAGWTDQVVEADVKAVSVNGSNRFFGLVARYGSSGNYYYFILRTNNTIELKKLVNGASTTLDSDVFTVSTGTWYSLKLEVTGTTLKAYINGSLKLQASDSQFTSGKAGVLTYFSAVSFDDVYADPAPNSPVLVADDFQDGNATGWTPNSTSNWSVVTDGSLAYRQTDTSALAISAVGSTSWADQIIEIDAKALSFNFDTSNDRWFGIMARYTNENNYYYVTIRTTNEVHLRRIVNGTFTTLATAPLTVSTGTWYLVKFKVIGNSLKVYINGELKLQATDSALVSGQPGLIMYKGDAVYDDVIVTKP